MGIDLDREPMCPVLVRPKSRRIPSSVTQCPAVTIQRAAINVPPHAPKAVEFGELPKTSTGLSGSRRRLASASSLSSAS